MSERSELDRLRAERLKLDKRIHAQRVALRQNWEIVEQRADHYKKLPLMPRLLDVALRYRREKEEARDTLTLFLLLSMLSAEP